MAREQNVFYNLVRNENTLTELLCNMSKYQIFRRVITEEINSALGIQCPVFEQGDISTQERDPEIGQPDIRIDSSDTLILVECKVDDSALTQRQVLDYPKSIEREKKQNAGLLFLVPDNYQHLSIIKDMVSIATKSHRTSFTTWSSLVARLDSYGLSEANELFRDFIALLKQWFEPVSILFTKGELQMLFNKEAGKTYASLIKLVDQVHDILAKSYSCSKGRNTDEYGFYVKDQDGKRFLWFGIWYYFWEESGCPMSLGLPKSRKSPKRIAEGIRAADIEDSFFDFFMIPDELLLRKENSKDLGRILLSLLEQMAPHPDKSSKSV